MSDFMKYQKAQSELAVAVAQHEVATLRLEARTRETRYAELVSQSFDSLKLAEDLGEISERERVIGIAFARHALYGRTDNPGFKLSHGKPGPKSAEGTYDFSLNLTKHPDLWRVGEIGHAHQFASPEGKVFGSWLKPSDKVRVISITPTDDPARTRVRVEKV